MASVPVQFSGTAIFPVEIWREIIRLATTAPDTLCASVSVSAPGKPGTLDAFHDGSFATKRALALTSYAFWEMTCEFLYETVYIARVEHARRLAASPALQAALGRWTKHLVVAPVFDKQTTHAEYSPRMRELGAALARWAQICAAVPPGVRRLDLDDENIFAPAPHAPGRALEPKFGSFLCALRSTAVRGARAQHAFPQLARLALHSWPVAGAWAMPALAHLHITHFPNLPRTAGFWAAPKPRLARLAFGHATDLGDFPELAALLARTAPNLRALEYYYYGDAEMAWDARALPASLKEVTIRTFHRTPSSGPSPCRLTFEPPEDGGEPAFPPAEAERWMCFARHIAAFSVRPTVIVPQGVSLARLRAAVEPILAQCGADACFVEAP
ncbi:hypothetical protein DFH11DRAFT_1723896 [Phellopilus nigrolimitatus]|nr:hypothetical protein DFH11DRAFT_1723896 [Phellopilus nigrolimitatus]